MTPPRLTLSDLELASIADDLRAQKERERITINLTVKEVEKLLAEVRHWRALMAAECPDSCSIVTLESMPPQFRVYAHRHLSIEDTERLGAALVRAGMEAKGEK